MDNRILYHHTTNVHNKRAAGEMVPFFIRQFNPESVVDVGCGLGSWLKVFQEQGIDDIHGFDGRYVDVSKLFIMPGNFSHADLEKPLPVTRRYDLALCLEVAEHLNRHSAGTLINSLISLSDIIIFSAAIPEQGGQNHINEQWPSWWSEKFKVHGFNFYDVFREKFWDNDHIDWWYRQNIFLVTKPEIAAQQGFQVSCRALVHPELFLNKINKIKDYENGEISVLNAFKVLRKSMFRAIRRRR